MLILKTWSFFRGILPGDAFADMSPRNKNKRLLKKKPGPERGAKVQTVWFHLYSIQKYTKIICVEVMMVVILGAQTEGASETLIKFCALSGCWLHESVDFVEKSSIHTLMIYVLSVGMFSVKSLLK